MNRQIRNANKQVTNLAIVESMVKCNQDFKVFKQLPLVKGMVEEHALELFCCMSRKSFVAGDVIYQAGSASDSEMFMILEGKVNVRNESGYKYTSLRAGEVFGLFSFLDEQRSHSATIVVENDVTVLSMERAHFDLIAIEEPQLGNQLMRFMFSLLSKKALELEVEYAHMHNFAFGGKV